MSGLRVTEEAWQRAFRFSVANAAVFLFLSLMLFLWEPASLPIILFVPGLFGVGAMISFVLLIRSGGAFAAVAWFILGAGVYFGLGAVLGGLAPDPATPHFLDEWLLYSDLRQINLLNSASVILVLITSIPLSYRLPLPIGNHILSYQEVIEVLVKIFPLLTLVALGGVGLRFWFFPVAEDLLVRSFLSWIYVIVPFCILVLGMLWTRLEGYSRGLGVIVFLSALALSLCAMSKLEIISTVLAFVVGIWVHRRSIFFVTAGLVIVVALYAYLGGLANSGRAHKDYNASENSPHARIKILTDTIVLDREENEGGAAESAYDDAIIIPPMLLRFSIAAIQGFLVEQYESGSRGTSLDDFWVAAIPRVLWPEKPIVTRFGTELDGKFWNRSVESALAPTYSGEAYWNYGPLGVVLISILLGLENGWLTRRWHMAAGGSDPAFFLIAFPTAVGAAFVESWIAATYIGGFLIYVALWLCARFFLLTFFKPESRSISGRVTTYV